MPPLYAPIIKPLPASHNIITNPLLPNSHSSVTSLLPKRLLLSPHATMNDPHSTTATASEFRPWQDPFWSMGVYPYSSAPQSALLDSTRAPGQLIAADFDFHNSDVAGEFTKLLNDTFPVSIQTIRTSTLAYLAVPQEDADAWSRPAQCWSRTCFCEGPLCSPECKAFFDPSSVASQPVGEHHWPGVSPLATVDATRYVSANATYARALY
jgi:hypothetical protein